MDEQMKHGTEKRSLEQIREHYEIEKKLAEKLRYAESAERKKLYSAVYDELFTSVKHHPQVVRKASDDEKRESISHQMAFLKRFLQPSTRFLELGAGSCHLSLAVAHMVAYSYAVDVSEEIAKNLEQRNNFQFAVSDGCSIPVPPGNIDVAYSYQLIEHLHPDDAHEQLINIYKVLARGGIYVCITNNRVTGPHDISKYFDDIATGFHLKEYSSIELRDLFENCGFSKIQFYLGVKKRYFPAPISFIKWCEGIISYLPRKIRMTAYVGVLLKKAIDLLVIVGRKSIG